MSLDDDGRARGHHIAGTENLGTGGAVKLMPPRNEMAPEQRTRRAK